MSIYRALGNVFVSEEEIQEKAAFGKLSNFYDKVSKHPSTARIDFKMGMVSGTDLLSIPSVPDIPDTAPFEPIGPGKPLSIMIRHIFTGKYPENLFGGDTQKDMLVTTAIKASHVFNAAPRAINYIRKDVGSYTHIDSGYATEKGTPLVYYSPALVERDSILTLEMFFDDFPDEKFEAVSGILSSAAGIPVFATASFYLQAAGILTKLVGKVLGGLLESDAVFRQNDRITFNVPGSPMVKADFRYIFSDDFPENELAKCKFGPEGVLLLKNGAKYKDNWPYICISLDGQKEDKFKDFSPTAASAELLEKYFDIEENQQQSIDVLLDAIKLYNDSKFRTDADKLSQEMQNLDPSSDEYVKAKEKYNALVANIVNKVLKPAGS